MTHKHVSFAKEPNAVPVSTTFFVIPIKQMLHTDATNWSPWRHRGLQLRCCRQWFCSTGKWAAMPKSMARARRNSWFEYLILPLSLLLLLLFSFMLMLLLMLLVTVTAMLSIAIRTMCIVHPSALILPTDLVMVGSLTSHRRATSIIGTMVILFC